MILPVDHRGLRHRVELSDDARFNIHFWVAEETDGENGLFHAKKA